MKYYFMLTVVLLSVVVTFAQERSVRIRTPKGAVELTATQNIIDVRTIVRNIEQRLEQIKYMGKLDTNCAQVLDPVKEIVVLLDIIPDSVMAMLIDVREFQRISDGAFANLILFMEGEPFPDDRLKLLSEVAEKGYFSCDQLGQVLDRIKFDENKLTAVNIIWRRIVDPENAPKLQDKFESESEREKFLKIISK